MPCAGLTWRNFYENQKTYTMLRRILSSYETQPNGFLFNRLIYKPGAWRVNGCGMCGKVECLILNEMWCALICLKSLNIWVWITISPTTRTSRNIPEEKHNPITKFWKNVKFLRLEAFETINIFVFLFFGQSENV